MNLSTHATTPQILRCAGAVAGAQNTATEAVEDAYTGLKDLVRRRPAGPTSVEEALAEREDAPAQAGGVLEAELIAVEAGDDAARSAPPGNC